jgi:hypothetical protein
MSGGMTLGAVRDTLSVNARATIDSLGREADFVDTDVPDRLVADRSVM